MLSALCLLVALFIASVLEHLVRSADRHPLRVVLLSLLSFLALQLCLFVAVLSKAFLLFSAPLLPSTCAALCHFLGSHRASAVLELPFRRAPLVIK